jgi:hypothetical protein
MPRKPRAQRIDELEQRRVQLQNKIAALKAIEQRKDRRLDTRRKIIAGALALEHLATHPGSEFGKVLVKLLNDYVENPNRDLFPFLPKRNANKLKPLPKAKK